MVVKRKDPACKELRDLYCSSYAPMHIKLAFTWAGFMVVYYLCLFNSSELESGDPLTIGLLFGISEGLGVLVGERFLAYLDDYKGFLLFMPVTLILSSALKVPGLDSIFIYIVFCL